MDRNEKQEKRKTRAVYSSNVATKVDQYIEIYRRKPQGLICRWPFAARSSKDVFLPGYTVKMCTSPPSLYFLV